MRSFRIAIFASLIVALISACSDDSSPNPDNNNNDISSCVGCHTNKAALIELAEPDTASEGGGGCGGEAPHYEKWEKVLLDGTGYEQYKETAHGKMACTDCHNGHDKTKDKALAHSGAFLAKPSAKAQEKCASCHSAIVASSTNSIHEQGWGQKRKVAMRAGLAGPHEFEDLPAMHKTAYNKNCATCHAGCGECHVVRPHAGGDGLANGHMFEKKPDMRKVCVTCHVSRGGHAYLGVASGTKPDVHLTKMNFTCQSCHKMTDIHGDGKMNEQRYAVSGLPKCADCHSNVSGSNKYHSMHIDNLSCYTCHSQPYNNCSSCHIGGEGARIPSHQDFKIALNPIPELRKPKWVLVRQTPMAPDSWSKYGILGQSDFNKFPTWNYTSPHNINRWTAVTQVGTGEQCYAKCHIIKSGDKYFNKELFLFEENLNSYEKEATRKITVNGKLPSSWGVQ